MNAAHSTQDGSDLLGLLERDLIPAARRRAGTLLSLAAAETRLAAMSVFGILLLLILCAAAIVVGWGIVIASLLYVVSEYSMTTWLLTALGISAAHAVLAACCWHYALALVDNLALPRTRSELASGGDARTRTPDNSRQTDEYFDQRHPA